MAETMRSAVRFRKSVRSFDGRALSTEDLQRLEEYAKGVTNPFGIPVEFRFLDAAQNQLTSPVIVGEKTYMAAKIRRVPHFEEALGYSFEEVCVFAASIGVGTTILAATLSRKTFEAAMNVGSDEVMPVVSPLGYASADRSLREKVMRKGLKADTRLEFEKLFYDGSFGHPLTATEAGEFREALESLRWAPSATNKQPWRAVKTGNIMNFYELQTLKTSPLGDIQRVDVGIALANFDITVKEDHLSGQFVEKDPGLEIPDNVQYVISWELQPKLRLDLYTGTPSRSIF
ncbi:MAG: nitroreductase [Clostridia bacterium]|nr:nitroreductase [Clostridia bacterium]